VNLDALLGALAGIPKLHGARCVGRGPELFDLRDPSDADRAEVEERAVAICLTECEAYSQCRDWIQSLPARRRPTGVVAGVVRRPRAPRQRKTAAQLGPKQLFRNSEIADTGDASACGTDDLGACQRVV
jgi:Transcription factor WhiB